MGRLGSMHEGKLSGAEGRRKTMYGINFGHIGCDGCEYERTPHFEEVNERTGHVWVYRCIGTSCANWPGGTPTNVSIGCSYYMEKYQTDIFDFLKGCSE